MTDKHDWDTALAKKKKAEEQMHATAEQQTEPEKPTGGSKQILVAMIAAIVVAIGGLIAVSQLNQAPETAPIISDDIPGDPVNFDPPSSLQEVQQFAGNDVRLLSIAMSQIRQDGTIELSAADNATAEYVFVRGSASAGRDYVRVVITDETMTRTLEPIPEGDAVPDFVPPPNCTIEALWILAKTYDAPSIGTAFVRYDENGYHFVIRDFNVDLQFNENCILVR